MKAYISVIQHPEQKEITRKLYPTEEEAQNEFDAHTSDSAAYGGRVQMDLVAEHPTEGNLVRKTSFLRSLPPLNPETES